MMLDDQLVVAADVLPRRSRLPAALVAAGMVVLGLLAVLSFFGVFALVTGCP